MTHQVDAVVGAVRIFRTPFCRIPPSLTSISNPPTTGNTPPPNLPAMKIMRRGGDGDTGPSPSKATSETGSEAKEKAQSAKEKYDARCSCYIPEANIDEDFPERSEKQFILLHVNEFLAKKINLARLHQVSPKETSLGAMLSGCSQWYRNRGR